MTNPLRDLAEDPLRDLAEEPRTYSKIAGTVGRPMCGRCAARDAACGVRCWGVARRRGRGPGAEQNERRTDDDWGNKHDLSHFAAFTEVSKQSRAIASACGAIPIAM